MGSFDLEGVRRITKETHQPINWGAMDTLVDMRNTQLTKTNYPMKTIIASPVTDTFTQYSNVGELVNRKPD